MSALVHAVPVTLVVLGLFAYWFGVADRYAVFLYGHLGATPFDEVTSGRYWMAGLVAGGIVMVVYTGANWLLARAARLRRRRHSPPPWWRVWALCAGPLLAGIPAITMTLNRPTLPPANALGSTAATLAGLALALMPGAWAAGRPADLAWLALDGLGLLPSLALLRALELPARGLSVGLPLAYGIAIGGTLAGAAWLGVTTALRAWRRRASPGAGALFASGLCLSYLLIPLAHHLFATPPGYRYITASSNFFAFHPAPSGPWPSSWREGWRWA
jgi:hypothetical protein